MWNTGKRLLGTKDDSISQEKVNDCKHQADLGPTRQYGQLGSQNEKAVPGFALYYLDYSLHPDGRAIGVDDYHFIKT